MGAAILDNLSSLALKSSLMSHHKTFPPTSDIIANCLYVARYGLCKYYGVIVIVQYWVLGEKSTGKYVVVTSNLATIPM